MRIRGNSVQSVGCAEVGPPDARAFAPLMLARGAALVLDFRRHGRRERRTQAQPRLGGAIVNKQHDVRLGEADLESLQDAALCGVQPSRTDIRWRQER